jgi:large subunit ribosomal protein L24
MNEMKSKTSKKIRKGDKVIAISGNYRGKTGTVLSCSGDKVVVQGLNVRKRHMKGQRDRPGQILQIEKPINISNLKLCTADGMPVKLRVRTDDAGERQLYYKDGAEEVLYRAVKKPQT